jgi:anti-sigma factor RsiW
MKWFCNRCRQRRQDLCLLAADALDADRKPELERHLASCRACHDYFAAVSRAASPLARWQKSSPPLEATPQAKSRWNNAVRQAQTPNPVWLVVWLELIRPNRQAWAGLAALWVLLLAVNSQLSDPRHPSADRHAFPASDMWQAWQEQNQILAELTRPVFISPAPPAISPRPRSERERHWEMT